MAYDNERTAFLNANGIHVLRYTNREIYDNISSVYEDIMNWIAKIEQTHPSPPLSGRGYQGIENYEIFSDSHIPDISSTALRAIIPDHTSLHAYFDENPKFIIP